MSQSKKASAYESQTNQILGVLMSYFIWIVIVGPFLGIATPMGQSTIVIFIFTVASFIRGYLVRRFFNWLEVRKESLH